MRQTTIQHGDDVEVRLAGALTMEDHAAFRALLAAIAQRRPRHCSFDLRALETIDSAGIGMLLIAAEEAKKSSWSFSVDNPTGHVGRVLELADLAKVMTIRG